MHGSALLAALFAGAHLASAMPVNAAYGHYDSLVRAVRAQPTSHAEQSSLLARFLRVFGDHHLERTRRAGASIHKKRSTATEIIKTRPRGIGMTYTHLPEGDAIYDESIFADAEDADDLPVNIKQRDIAHRGMGEPFTASIAQITATQVAQLGPGPEKLVSTGSAVPTPSASALEEILTQLPTLTTTLTLVPTLETEFRSKSGSAAPTPITTRIVYVDEKPASSSGSSASASSASTWVLATQVKLAGSS